MSLGCLPGHSTSVACGVSADGSVVVGWSGDFVTTEAFRWTQKTGMVSLGTIRGRSGDSMAFDVSADGSVIVGRGAGDLGDEAFIWDDTHEMRSIQRVLIRDFHVGDALRGWSLRSATAVSDDGTVVVGSGLNHEGN